MSDRKVINPAMNVYHTVRKREERLEQSAYETRQSPLHSYLSSKAAKTAGALCAAPPLWEPHPLG